MKLSLTIPIYNEEACIAKTITNITREYEKHGVDYELVLINHGSWDKTAEILNELAKKNKRLKVFNLEKNLGFGGGIRFGFSKSKGEVIGFDCADGEVSAEENYKVFSEFEKSKFDIVKALRKKRKNSIFRIFTSFVFNSFIFLRFRLKVKDINGYPIFMKREIYEKLNLVSKDFMFNLDLYQDAVKKKISIEEIPVVHTERVAGKSFMSFKEVIKMGISLLEYSFKKPKQ